MYIRGPDIPRLTPVRALDQVSTLQMSDVNCKMNHHHHHSTVSTQALRMSACNIPVDS